MKTFASRWCKYLQTEKHLVSKSWGFHSSFDENTSLLGRYTVSTDKTTVWQQSNKTEIQQKYAFPEWAATDAMK